MSAEDIRAAIATVKSRPKIMDFPLPGTLYGVPVYKEPLPPQKIKLSERINVSPQFRADFDAWLLETFGRQDPLLGRNQVLFMGQYGYLCSHESYNRIVDISV